MYQTQTVSQCLVDQLLLIQGDHTFTVRCYCTAYCAVLILYSCAGKLVQVNTGDREVLYFEAPRGKQHFLTQQDLEEIEWYSWTSVLGPAVEGVWPPYTDVTDVNAACVSHDGQVIATGDDFGYVKLLKYPSPVSNFRW